MYIYGIFRKTGRDLDFLDFATVNFVVETLRS